MKRVLRCVIDAAAVFIAFSIQFSASGSIAASVLTALAVDVYGIWCFYDGVTA